MPSAAPPAPWPPRSATPECVPSRPRQSTTFVDNDLLMALDKVGVHAQNAHALASGDATTASTASRITELTGHAVRSWRRLAQLDEYVKENNARVVRPALLALSA
jgi:hypothetical protein